MEEGNAFLLFVADRVHQLLQSDDAKIGRKINVGESGYQGVFFISAAFDYLFQIGNRQQRQEVTEDPDLGMAPMSTERGISSRPPVWRLRLCI